MASSLSVHFKAALQKTAYHLSEANVRDLASLGENIPPSRRNAITDGMDLFNQLQKHDLLHENNVNNLITWLNELQLHKASEPLVEYRERYLQSKRKPVEKCPDHQDEIIVQFCITCSCKICQKCYHRSHRAIFGCEVIDLESMNREINSRRETLRGELTSLRQCHESTNKLLTEKKQEVSQFYETLRKNICEDKTLMNERTNACASKLLESIKDYERTTSERLDVGEEQIEDILAALDNIRELRTEQDDNIISELRKIHGYRKKVGNFQQVMQRLQNDLQDKFSNVSYKKVNEDPKFGELRLSTLIGGVAIDESHLVRLFDERQTKGGVCLVCVDPRDPTKEHWRHKVTIDDNKFRVVLSYLAMASEQGLSDREFYLSILNPFKGGLFNVLFAIGKRVFIVQTQTNAANLATSLDLADIQDSSFITSICSSTSILEPLGTFFVSVSDSTIIREYRDTGEPLAIIDTTGWVSSIRCIANCERSFAIIDSNCGDIILLKSDDEVKKTGTLRLPSHSANFTPVCILFTGALWLALYDSGVQREWKVVTYEISGKFSKVNKTGVSQGNDNCPVSITRFRNTGFLSFANKSVTVFTH